MAFNSNGQAHDGSYHPDAAALSDSEDSRSALFPQCYILEPNQGVYNSKLTAIEDASNSSIHPSTVITPFEEQQNPKYNALVESRREKVIKWILGKATSAQVDRLHYFIQGKSQQLANDNYY
jgi:hypothetical protein